MQFEFLKSIRLNLKAVGLEPGGQDFKKGVHEVSEELVNGPDFGFYVKAGIIIAAPESASKETGIKARSEKLLKMLSDKSAAREVEKTAEQIEVMKKLEASQKVEAVTEEVPVEEPVVEAPVEPVVEVPGEPVAEEVQEEKHKKKPSKKHGK